MGKCRECGKQVSGAGRRLGKTQQAIMDYINDNARWYREENIFYVADIYEALGEQFSKPSLSRALSALVKKRLVYRADDIIRLPDEIEDDDYDKFISRAHANGLPWWNSKRYRDKHQLLT